MELKTFLAIPPTITEIGMAAILPNASALQFYDKNDKFYVGYEWEFKGRDDRMNWLLQMHSDSLIFNITDVLRLDLKNLRGKIQAKNRDHSYLKRYRFHG